MKQIIGILIIGALPIFAYCMQPSEQKGSSKKATLTLYKRKPKNHPPKLPYTLFAYNPTRITHQTINLYNPTLIQHVPIVQQPPTSTATKQTPPPAYKKVVYPQQDIYGPEMEASKQKIKQIIDNKTKKLSQLVHTLIKRAINPYYELTIEDILSNTSPEYIAPKTIHLLLSWALHNLAIQDHHKAQEADLDFAHFCLDQIAANGNYSLLKRKSHTLGTRSPSTQVKKLCDYHRKGTLMCPTCALACRLRLFVEYGKQLTKKPCAHYNFALRK